jgi:hypothetical protein
LKVDSHDVSGASARNTRAARFYWLGLVLSRQQDRGGATVCLGDDPKLLALSSLVVAQQTIAFLKRKMVLAEVFFRELPEIAGHVTAQKLNRCLSGYLERFFGSGRDEGLA